MIYSPIDYCIIHKKRKNDRQIHYHLFDFSIEYAKLKKTYSPISGEIS